MFKSIKKIFQVVVAVFRLLIFFVFNKFIPKQELQKEIYQEPEQPIEIENKIVQDYEVIPEVIKKPEPLKEHIQKQEYTLFTRHIKSMISEFTTQQEPETVVEYYLGVRVRGIPPDPNKCNEHMRIQHPCFHEDRSN